MIEPSYLRATRAAYDAVAAYAEWVSNDLTAKPLDRALLGVFAELGHGAGAGPVADLGCGPGRLTAHLHSLGLSAFGRRPVAIDGCPGPADVPGPACRPGTGEAVAVAPQPLKPCSAGPGVRTASE
jgi:hypothetical protein